MFHQKSRFAFLSSLGVGKGLDLFFRDIEANWWSFASVFVTAPCDEFLISMINSVSLIIFRITFTYEWWSFLQQMSWCIRVFNLFFYATLYASLTSVSLSHFNLKFSGVFVASAWYKLLFVCCIWLIWNGLVSLQSAAASRYTLHILVSCSSIIIPLLSVAGAWHTVTPLSPLQWSCLLSVAGISVHFSNLDAS